MQVATHLAVFPRAGRGDRVVGRGRQAVQPDPEECPGPRMVAGGGQHGVAGGLGFSQYRAGRLGDLTTTQRGRGIPASPWASIRMLIRDARPRA